MGGARVRHDDSSRVTRIAGEKMGWGGKGSGKVAKKTAKVCVGGWR